MHFAFFDCFIQIWSSRNSFSLPPPPLFLAHNQNPVRFDLSFSPLPPPPFSNQLRQDAAVTSRQKQRRSKNKGTIDMEKIKRAKCGVSLGLLVLRTPTGSLFFAQRCPRLCAIVKGSVSQDFRLPFFHYSIPSRPLIIRLYKIRKKIRFWFGGDIWSQSSKSSTPRCAWHCGVKILG